LLFILASLVISLEINMVKNDICTPIYFVFYVDKSQIITLRNGKRISASFSVFSKHSFFYLLFEIVIIMIN
jgi:hypothetical protein